MKTLVLKKIIRLLTINSIFSLLGTSPVLANYKQANLNEDEYWYEVQVPKDFLAWAKEIQESYDWKAYPDLTVEQQKAVKNVVKKVQAITAYEPVYQNEKGGIVPMPHCGDPGCKEIDDLYVMSSKSHVRLGFKVPFNNYEETWFFTPGLQMRTLVSGDNAAQLNLSDLDYATDLSIESKWRMNEHWAMTTEITRMVDGPSNLSTNQVVVRMKFSK